jgi:hypothetical protein
MKHGKEARKVGLTVTEPTQLQAAGNSFCCTQRYIEINHDTLLFSVAQRVL